ncbi:MAG: sodium:proton antiporter [Eubacteriales bacterium]|nr:sodium:proton antiporter [Eubacteriales bacterium]
MRLVENVPMFSIMLSMTAGFVSAMLPRRAAKGLTVGLAAAVLGLNVWLLSYLAASGVSFTYMMGHFPAPWGNELRAGTLEALMAVALSAVMLFSILAGQQKLQEQVDEKKQHLFFVMLDLVLAALMALIYTNDLFTAYVFIEILTVASCTLIMARQVGHAMVAAMRYMIMSLLGSGLLLLAISLLYGLTGQLLMEPIHKTLTKLTQNGAYALPVTVIIGLFCVGLGIKSGLFPFHTWLPDAYGYATPMASAVLSSLISKGYIFLLLKIFYRVIGIEVVQANHALNLLFAFGLLAMIFGSLSAIRSHDLRRMIAFSSVSQIGYIYAGIGLGTTAGVIAALFQLLVHSLGKSMLFLSTSGLSDASGDSKRFDDLRGAGYRYPAAGAAFTIGALSMVGVPILGGFFSKVYLAQTAFAAGGVSMWLLLGALAASTLLNAFYFMHTVMSLYRQPKAGFVAVPFRRSALTSAALLGLSAVNLCVGFFSQSILQAIRQGLSVFS